MSDPDSDQLRAAKALLFALLLCGLFYLAVGIVACQL